MFSLPHKCQNPNCKNKNEHLKLKVHHIKFQSKGIINTPNNLVTLCEKCHTPENHLPGGFLYEWQKNKPKLKIFKAESGMNIIRNRIVDEVKKYSKNVEMTFGYITKANRERLKIEKTHYNDAFTISGGEKQTRFKPFEIKQKRRNNRVLEKFYDAKYIDIRSGQKVLANVLNNGRICRNTNKNNKSLRKYRGKKVSCGHRNIRTIRFPYQSGDLIKIDEKIFTVHSSRLRYGKKRGNYITVETKENSKVYFEYNVKPYKFQKGFILI